MFFSNSDGIITEIYLTEKQTDFFPRKNRFCKRYNPGEDRNSVKQDSKDFINCSKEKLWTILKTQINCSIIGLEPFLDHPKEIRQCKSKEEAALTYWASFDTFLSVKSNRTLWDSLCPLPCFQVIKKSESCFAKELLYQQNYQYY